MGPLEVLGLLQIITRDAKQRSDFFCVRCYFAFCVKPLKNRHKFCQVKLVPYFCAVKTKQ